MKKQNVIKMTDYCEKKGLVHTTLMMPDAYFVHMHIRNMMATYGEDFVKQAIKEMGLTETPKKQKKSA